MIPVMAHIALHPGLLRRGIILHFQEIRLLRFRAIIKLDWLAFLQLVVTALARVILFETVRVVGGIATDLLHSTDAAAEEGGRVEETTIIPAEGAGVTSFLLGFLLEIYS